MTAGSTPLLIAHRGVPAHRLEHTRAAYELAIEWGADFIEPDVVCTSDGHLVVRHENEISSTTDVADRPEFADRRTTKEVDGTSRTGWFSEDFTLAELRTLRAVERLPDLRPHNVALNGSVPILSFEDVLDIAAAAPRRVGVYVETKHPNYFRDLGLDLDVRLIAALERRDLNRPGADVPVIIQSFETGNLRGLRDHTPLPLIFLVDARGGPWDLHETGRTYADLITPEGLAEVATFADGIGPHKDLVLPRTDDDRLGSPSSLVADAHAAGLLVHPWTVRPENSFLPVDLRSGDEPSDLGDAVAEVKALLEAGVDGLFSDDASLVTAAVQQR